MRRVVTIACGLTLAVGIVGAGSWTVLGGPTSTTAEPAALTTEEADDTALAAPPPAAPVAVPACAPDPALTEGAVAAPRDLAGALDRFLSDPTVAPHASGVSIWVDGYGEVLAHEPDRRLAPASNQKLFTAIGALAVLGTEHELVTEVVLTPDGDLIVVGGGDPTLTIAGAHSLDALATRVRDAGITHVTGGLLVDESRHDGTRRASGWFDWQIPGHTGPMSAFMVDRNRWRGDAAFLADPALANAERLRARLAARGVTVAGPTAYAETTPTGTTVASLVSRPVAHLVADMVRHSDNQIADLLLKEVGAVGIGEGSADAGALATEGALEGLCLDFEGAVDDGSGLSRANQRSAREWRALLHAIRGESWFAELFDGLPVAARSGTLGSRFGGTAAAGTVRAKTGTIIGGAALSGYGTTASGRAFVFSVVVNGDGAQAAAAAIDRLVAAAAAHPA